MATTPSKQHHHPSPPLSAQPTTAMPSANIRDPGDDPSRRDLQTPLLSREFLPDPAALPEKLPIDDMLQKYCGEFGTWQLRHFVLTSLAWALEAFHTMVMIFADRQPRWRCVSPAGCPPVDDACDLPRDAWEWIGGAASSTVAQWDLVCGERYKVGLVQALFFSGCMIGAGVFGHLSDTSLGRRGSLATVCILNSIFGILTAFSPSFSTYAALRLLTGFSTGGVGLCAFVLATEPVGPSKRGVAGMSTFYFFAGGIALLSPIAYIFQSWRHLYIATSVPSLLFVLLVIPFIAESPRWQIIRGKLGRAMITMRAIAAANGRTLPSGVNLALDDEASSANAYSSSAILSSFNWSVSHKSGDADNQRDAIKGSLLDVLRSPITRMRLFLAVTINFLCSVVYYGLSLNVGNLRTNLYLSVLLNAISEMPAFLLTAMLIDRFGRKPLTIGALWFSGGFCLVGSVMAAHGPWKHVKMVCGVMGIFGMAGTYNLLFIYTTELFPTVVRNAALGCATQAGQMGAIMAPFVVVLAGRLPFMIFAGCGILGGILGFKLPETLNQPLYDTMAGMEEGEASRNQDASPRSNDVYTHLVFQS